MAAKRIYLDVCALCRPHDNQAVMRNRIETDALYVILDRVRQGGYVLLVSPAHHVEIDATAQHPENADVVSFLDTLGQRPRWDLTKARARAEELYRLRFGAADAAHVAFAEQGADVFITCDDDLLRKCRRLKIRIPATGPVEFLVSEGLR
jgi:hypothetical protein